MTLQEIRANEIAFQKEILKRKIDLEQELDPSRLIFLERGMPDSIAYYRLYGEDAAQVITASGRRFYKKIFLLDQAPFVKDYARTENHEVAQRISALIHEAYLDVGYDVIKIPLVPIAERAKILLSHSKEEVRRR